MKNINKRAKYVIAGITALGFMGFAYYLPAEFFITFTVGWLFLIPALFIAYMTYGLLKYRDERKHRIIIEPAITPAMRAIIRREEELRRAKENLLKEEIKIK
jgi:hypothetical protein